MNKQKEPNILRRFTRPYMHIYSLSILFAIIGVGCKLFPFYIASRIFILLLQQNRAIDNYIYWCIFLSISFIGQSLFHSLSTGFSHKATFSVISDIRIAMTEKLKKLPMGYILTTPSGKFKNIIVEKVDSIEPTMAHVLPEMSSNLLGPIGIIICLFIIDWRMALASLITIPIGIFSLLGMTKDYDKNFSKYTASQKHVNAVSVEYISGIEVIKTFNQSTKSYSKFSEAVKDSTDFAISWMKKVQVFFSVGVGVWPGVLIGVLPIGSYLCIKNSLSYENFITIILLSLGIVGPLMIAMNYTDDLAKMSSILRDIKEILNQKELKRPEIKSDITTNIIDLRNVCFTYDKVQVLSNINLTIPEKKITAFVGPSGSGKSTIAKLLASFWDINTGAITIDGVDTRDIPIKQLMDLIAYVSQDNFLFNDTIRNNIRIGKPDASNKEVEEIAKMSGCHNFIQALQHGYETIAGDSGSHISGGERQRITIARAMLKDSPIVILDEATAYTDPENEAVIQDAILKLVKDKTLIVIAHRLSTIINVDQIVVIDKGKIDGVGTHTYLLDNNILYKTMWESHIETKEGEVLC